MENELKELFLPLCPGEARFLASYRSGSPVVIDHSVIPSAGFLRDGKLINVIQHERFYIHVPHKHEYIEFAFMLSGSSSHKIEGETVLLREGDLLMMNLHASHAVAALGREDILISFIILPQFFERSLEFSGMEQWPVYRHLTDILIGKNGKPDYLIFNTRENLPARNLIENLIWTIKKDVPLSQSTNQMTMALLLRLLSREKEISRSGDGSDDMLRSLYRYIDDRYRDGDLADAAKTLHFNYRWLSRKVLQKTGKTFTELLQERRL